MNRILYVDDEPALLDVTGEYLRCRGNFVVDTVDSARSAQEKLKEITYDAVVSDYQMPDMDGIGLLKYIRRHYGHMPFILFTGRGREEIVIQALENGADFYLQKGGDPKSQFTELIHKINQAIGSRRAEEELRESEERYRNVVEDQTEFICRFLPDGTHIFVNEAYCRYFNKKREDIDGCLFRPMVHPGDREIVSRHIASLTPQHPVENIDQRIIMPDGRIRWQRWSDRAIFNDEGEVVEYQSVGRDITGQKEAEQALFNSKTELHAVLYGSPIPQFVIDNNHRVIHWNKALEEYSGIRAEEVVGTNQHWRAFYSCERPCIADLLVNGATGRIPELYNGNYTRSKLIDHAYEATGFFPKMGKNGKWMHFTAAPILDGEGTVIGAVETLEDVTGEREAKEALEKQHEELLASYGQLAASEEEVRQNYEELARSQRALVESEERYRTVFENTGTAMIIIEEDTTISLANSRFSAFTGFSREEIEGKKSWTEFVVPEDLATMQEYHHERRKEAGSAPARYEFRFISRTGEIRSILLTAGMIPGTKKSVASLLDITDRQQAQETLREREERYRAFFTTSIDCVFITSVDGRWVDFNDSAVRFFGYAGRDELLSVNIRDLYEDQQGRDRHLAHIMAIGYSREYPVNLKKKDGTIINTLITAVPVRDAGGGVIRFQGTIHDVTERKKREDALQKANRQLTLLSSITRHDILNKVTVLLGYFELLREKPESTGISDLIKNLEAATRAIRDEIEFTRRYQELGIQEPQWLNLKNFIPHCVVPPPTAFHAAIPSVEVYADPMLGKVFLNLLDNSVKHGGTVTKISLNGRETQEGFLVIWEDDGIGIPGDEKEKIFGMGYGRNSGFGLFFVREILSITGIGIRETGEPGRGARFEILVPKDAYRFR